MLNKSKIIEIKNKIYSGKNFFLKKITLNNYNKNYVSWLNNKKVNKFLESRFQKQNLKKIKQFVKNANKDHSIILFGIFYKKEHIGNIKININWYHEYATLGYLIGVSKYQGKNIGSESIKICTNICFRFLKLRFCLASVYAKNIASSKVLEKNRFKVVSKIKNVYKIDKNTYTDKLTYRLYNSKFKS